MYGGFTLNGIPDLSQLDFSNIDFSQFNAQQPAPVPAPVSEPALASVPVFDPSQFVAPVPAPTPTPEPTPAPAPEFDPYVGMTQADLAEIGMVAPLSQTLPAPTPAPQPSAPTGIETMAPNFQMTEDFALPVEQQQLMPATTPVTPTPEPEQLTPSQYYEQRYGVSGVPDDYSFNGAELPDETARAILQAVANGQIAYGPDLTVVQQPAGTEPYTMDSELGDTFVFDPSVYIEPTPEPAPEPTVNEVAQNLVSAGNFYTDGQLADMGIEPGTLTTPSGRVLDEVRATEDEYGFIPPDEYITAASDFYTDGQLADMGIEPGTAVSTGANPQQPAGTQIDLTPEQQGYIDAWIESNPAGSIINTPVGNISLPELSQYTGGGSSPTTNVDAAQYVIQNLVPQASETARGGRVATTFGGPVNAPQQSPRANPFQRPEEGGIASLVPSGG